MANVVTDPKDHPDAIIPDLTRPDPLLTFGKAQIAFVYGSKWKQRLTKAGDDYSAAGAVGRDALPVAAIMSPQGPIGGRPSIRRRTASGRQDRRATAATR